MLEMRIQREVLLGYDFVAKAAQGAISGRAARWMLGQPRDVRRSYVHDVLDRPDSGKETVKQAWMLRQDEPVRRSFIEEVLLAGNRPVVPEQVWMLRQPDSTRLSYVEQVIEAPDDAVRPEVQWMLRQPDTVRESYIDEVLLATTG